jgi:hypothetical protein
MGDQPAADPAALRARLEALPESIGPLIGDIGTPDVQESLHDLDRAWVASRAVLQSYVESLSAGEGGGSSGGPVGCGVEDGGCGAEDGG